MNLTPITSKGEQARKQLIAAALEQFGEYGLNATTRDIAASANSYRPQQPITWCMNRSSPRCTAI